MSYLAEITVPNPESLIDAAWLRAVARLAASGGDARFTPGGGVLLDRPLSNQDRLSLPAPKNNPPRWLDLPDDRFRAHYRANSDFRSFIDSFTVAHARKGYRLVVIPLGRPLSARQLLTIAACAEDFGHGSLRLTADVSIRLPNVPVALLRPLYDSLARARLFAEQPAEMAA
ncbi:MAG: hypothetical protein KDA67_05495 [Rhodobacteraceae bacterium]|nr:hypothetical protein [Paracoccaceae bacterium]